MAAPMEHLSTVCRELEGWEISRGEPRVDTVRQVTELFREATYRDIADEKTFLVLSQILSRASCKVQSKSETSDPTLENWLDLSAECFRCLRNACVQCAKNQNTIRDVGLIEETLSLITIFSSSSNCSESCLVAFRCGLQFLGNVAGGNQGSQNRIWNHAFPQLFLKCLAHEDEKVATYGSMVLFTCMDDDNKMADFMNPVNLSVAISVITAYSKRPYVDWLFQAHVIRTCDYAYYLNGGKCLSLRSCEITDEICNNALLMLTSKNAVPVNENITFAKESLERENMVYLQLQLIVTDRFLRYPQLLKQIYASLNHSDRVVLLEMIMSKVSDKSALSVNELSSLQEVAEFLSECFQNQCKDVLKLASSRNCDEEEAVVVVRLLDILCEMTSDSEHLTCLQSCPGLLDTVVDTLRLTHLAGKQSKNIFTSTHTASLGSELTHAAVGFKAHLIRLIANLCYRNKDNQDKYDSVMDTLLLRTQIRAPLDPEEQIYQLEGIPLILDNCSIDDNNPFLNQWAVYAVRNLTEHNEKNQGVIASLERQGLADTSVLERMGLAVEERDGKLVLKSVKKM